MPAPEITKERIKCQRCDKSFAFRESLVKHRRKVHPETIGEVEKTEKSHNCCQEEGCQYAASSINYLRRHLEKEHGKQFTIIEKTFKSYQGKGLQRF